MEKKTFIKILTNVHNYTFTILVFDLQVGHLGLNTFLLNDKQQGKHTLDG